ncbi:MAG: GxxExxY protein, partial [Spirochaetaceae bacterium]|nr:GxxExxY protein [Spirochaetaceae bacterium]
MELLYKDEVYAILGAAMNVHNELGSGFLEAVYQEALEKEFALQNIPSRKEFHLPIYYKKQLLVKQYIADFFCYDKIIVELKALSKLNTEHYAQVLNYIKASNLELGLLINFGQSKLEYKRIIREHSRSFADKKEDVS